jgi:hypothetical protein
MTNSFVSVRDRISLKRVARRERRRWAASACASPYYAAQLRHDEAYRPEWRERTG